MDLYLHSHGSSNHTQFRWVAVAAVAGLLGVSIYWFHGLVAEYGMEGAINYIWEGDPYPNLRERINTLRTVEQKIKKPEQLLNKLESALERSHLDSIDGTEAAMVVQQWQSNLPSVDLRTRLGILSSDFDKLAAQVDGVVSEGSDVLKDKKKVLSKRIVTLMERVDNLIAFYKKGRTITSTTQTQ